MTEEKSKYQAPETIPHDTGPRAYQFEFKAKHVGMCCLCYRWFPAGAKIVKLEEPKVSTREIAFGKYKHHTRQVSLWYAHKACAEARPQDAEVIDDASE